MGRHLLAAAVVVADTALWIGVHHGAVPVWGVAVYALAATSVAALRGRAPLVAFMVALLLAPLGGAAYVLLPWASYRAGRVIVTRAGSAAALGAVIGSLAVRLLTAPPGSHSIGPLISTYLVFVALPLLTGRYLAQHERLVTTLHRHNRRLRAERELLAEQERLRERLRIAREMHDSLGHRLGLLSVQAAALEVSSLPPEREQSVRLLATTARAALTELHELVGALRDPDDADGGGLGVEAIDALVEEFGQAGVPVSLRRQGEPVPLPAAAERAAYRVVQEGLTNAAKHAPGQPVTVGLQWESDALLLTVTNPVAHDDDAGGDGTRAGHGLRGLGERVRPAGGLLDHGRSGGRFRLFAMLPTTREEPAAAEPDHLLLSRERTTAVVGVFAAALLFVLLPASMLAGVL
ncbi:hypothetical protein Sme01_07350 [Sphaerisporangium melleum]|uniref:histidine kinase n=1 Tax=Sphaerisporangium melleum TaxID=321316 RepID=A0A917QWX3_9ACTN|nr:histidine kinase [Sphaerisporangium melleum]GGK73046.1 hypothetical protein GCM10007964_14850 [Sphaerisporangium melleum]GII68259.1 hypothetical protein Sme01_07350 [Sphaerisporangium melleum]